MTTYSFIYKDNEGDLIETEDMSYEDAKAEAEQVRREGGAVIETWRYVDGEFAGRPNL
jgi:hypothetical protein